MEKGKKFPTAKTFNPERYGMAICSLCNGKGKLRENSDEFIVCTGCGGFGLTKKKDNLHKV